ncbi:iron-dicitrate transporter substrate-binding subunit (plasmid) [Escherichia coli O157:H43 str. T22]|jgi:hypothetical protein|nr:iron-dicitrate transporter substrate-binding subunit [Escherichia coli O157:H43 str. T22]
MLAFIRFLFAGLLLVISHAFAATVQDGPRQPGGCKSGCGRI